MRLFGAGARATDTVIVIVVHAGMDEWVLGCVCELCVRADCSSVFRIVSFAWNNEMRKYFRVYSVDTLCAMCI